MTTRIPLLYDHDGGIDDLLSLILLTTMPEIDLRGVAITPADCLLSDAVTSTLKLLQWRLQGPVPVARGALHGVNPFFHEWRVQPKGCLGMPRMLAMEADESWLSPLPAHEFLAQQLMASETKVTVLITGPCTNLVAALESQPACREQIDRVVWMGGAVKTKGNVVIQNHDGSAEWNAYWDPGSTAKLVGAGLDLHLVTLDACNQLPIDMAFLQQLSSQRDYALSDLAGQFWALTLSTRPTYECLYHLWDVLATCYVVLGDQRLTTEVLPISVATEEPNQGQTFVDREQGTPVTVTTGVDREAILSYLFDQFRRD